MLMASIALDLNGTRKLQSYLSLEILGKSQKHVPHSCAITVAKNRRGDLWKYFVALRFSTELVLSE